MRPKPTLWWRRKRKTDKPVWHFEAECPSFPNAQGIVVDKRPRNGTLCDWCQNIQKKSK